MKLERDAVSEVINSIHFQISRSEYYPSMSQSPKDACLHEAANADIFIGIYKNRYGFVPSEHNIRQISVTQMEYEAARKNTVPCLIFIFNKDEKREKKLVNFLLRARHFSKGQHVQKYESIADLKYQVLHSLVYHVKAILSDNDFKKLKNLLRENDPDPYRGMINWGTIDYGECEKIGCFSGIRIGNKSIFLKSPYQGDVRFFLFNNDKPKTSENRITLSQREFNFIINSIFTENEIYWITKDIWRASS